MKRFALAAVLVILGLTAAAQQFDLSIDNIMRGNGLVGWEPDDLRWSPDGTRVSVPHDTICIHADMEHAVERLRAIRQRIGGLE